MESAYQVFRVNPRGAYMQWLSILFFLVAMSTMGCGVMQTEDYISDLDMPIPTAHIAGVYGKKASLPCDTQPLTANDTVMMVLWFKEANWEPIYSYDVRGRSTNLPKLWSAPNGFGSRAFFRATAVPSTLLIDNVTSTDVGVYRCRVDFKNSPTRNLRVNFTVVIPPNEPIIMDLKANDTHRLLEPYNEGDTIELLCEVKGGYPSPSLIWYLENTVIDDSYDVKEKGVIQNTLIFPNIGRQHLNLRFICQASNTNLVPPQTNLATLEINLRPLTVQIVNKQQLSADRKYELICKSFGSRPEAEVTWWRGILPLRKNTVTFSDDNSTTTILMFEAEAKYHDVELTCRAENPIYANSAIKDTWRLNVHYFPLVNLKFGSNLNPSHIKEGDDVYFECNLKANPKATNLSWIKDHSQEIKHNASSGIILSEQRLVLQNVDRSASGDYSCSAQNSQGRASSNTVPLQVRYSPVCNSEEGQVWGASRFEPIELSCIVDSSPQPTSFEWAFNRNTDYHELPPSLSAVRGHKSILRYIPKEDRDFGTLSCWATNAVGKQEIPCTYNLVLVDRPTSLQNCSIVNQSLNNVIVDCLEGFDGGLQQVFIMEVVELPTFNVRANITSNFTPYFEVLGLDRGLGYALNLFSANSKGRSEVVTIYTAARSPDRHTDVSSALALSPVTASLLAAVAIMVAAAVVISVAMYRRHSAGRHTKQPVSPLYAEDSLESLPRRDNLPSYTPSQTVDYSTQYELNTNGEAESDPDIIPLHYDKKPVDDYCKAKVGDTVKVYKDHAIRSPNNGNISFVNRGVTASVRNLPVRESCI